jgi:hypothetical protein
MVASFGNMPYYKIIVNYTNKLIMEKHDTIQSMEADPMPTPSFTSTPISRGNKPGDLDALKFIFLGLVVALLLLFVFKK